MSKPVIIVAKKNKDALRDGYKDMALHSGLNIQKVVKREGDLYTGSYQGKPEEPAIVNHNLGYIPEVLLMEEFAENSKSNVFTPTHEDYNPGSFWDRLDRDYHWYCPSGVTEVEVFAWGGGGAGGGMTTNNVAGSGGGGAGGQYVSRKVAVVPGTVYRVRIGDGGKGGYGNGQDGTDTIFGNNLVVAKGGAGGKSYENGGGAGIGSTSGAVGTTIRRGGSGGVFHLDENGYNTLSEGGGGGGGPEGDARGSSYPNPGGYGYGVPAQGGGTIYEGNGAPGLPASMDGFSGRPAGGGGGGGGATRDFYTDDRMGGDGGYGFLRLSYFRTIENPRYFGNIGMGGMGRAAADLDENTITVHASGGYNPYKIWAHFLLDPLEQPATPVVVRSTPGRPVIKIYGSHLGDYTNKIDTHYDTLKVFKTGRLSVTAPGYTVKNGDNPEQVVEATVRHNLGYIPMFGPFVNSNISLDVYAGWMGQVNNGLPWSPNIQYLIKNTVKVGVSGEDINYVFAYECIKSHISDASNKPFYGENWEEFWVEIAQPEEEPPYGETFDGIVLNDFEDLKMRPGGIFGFNFTNVEYYATKTDLVLRITRRLGDAELLWGVPEGTSCVAMTIHVDYTIFYNNAEEQFDLLTN